MESTQSPHRDERRMSGILRSQQQARQSNTHVGFDKIVVAEIEASHEEGANVEPQVASDVQMTEDGVKVGEEVIRIFMTKNLTHKILD